MLIQYEPPEWPLLCASGCGLILLLVCLVAARSPAAPTVSIAPGGTVSTDTVRVWVTFCDYGAALDHATWNVQVTNATVVRPFKYTPGVENTMQAAAAMLAPCMSSGEAVGVIQITAGNTATVNASISNEFDQTASRQVTITYTPPDATPPVATITSPASGTFGYPELNATVVWSDGAALNPGSRLLTLNGDIITSSFDYTGSTTASTSTGSIWLQPGANLLTARICDVAGNCSVTDSANYFYSVSPTSAPLVNVAGVNAGSTVERSLCLTVSLGGGGVAECGDLRLAHALPATATFSKVRRPVLTYNSQHAHPYPYVYADVTLPLGSNVPDSVTAILTVNGAVRVPRIKWPGNLWVTGATRRISLGYDAMNDTTGVYPYSLEVTNWHGSVARPATVTGDVAIVNRANSYFGAGWWLAGLERLYPSSMVWVGGDGSVRKYASVAANVWAAPNLDRPDTLKWDGAQYVRYLSGGAQVRFDANGYHVTTVPRVGIAYPVHRTTFMYTSGRLTTIALPKPASAPARIYTLAYVGGKLATVTSPAVGATVRVTQVVGSSGRVTGFVDPDTHDVSFGYDPGFVNRIRSRTDRRNVVTSFAYDAAHKLAHDSTVMADGQEIRTNIRSVESQTRSPLATDPALLYVVIDGPRTVGDSTRFYLDRFSSPFRIKDALNDSTILQRADPRFPALVTEIRHPNGFREQATYNVRGNIATHTQLEPYGAGTPNTTTTYRYSSTWPDLVTRIIPPAEDSTALDYDPTTGHRIWQQDARGWDSRVRFHYNNPHQLLSSVYMPGGARDSLTYDVYGNVAQNVSPRRFVTISYKDNIGRDTLIVSPVDSLQTTSLRLRQRFGYDINSRVRWSETVGAEMNGVTPQTVRVETEYDPEGNVTEVKRLFSPAQGLYALVTSWSYDFAGRPVKEVAPDGRADSTVYDSAGNAIKLITRRNHVITMTYDLLNRMTEKRLQGFVVPQWTAGIPTHLALYGLPPEFVSPYPMHGNGSGFSMPADTARYTYDANGLLTANNRDAQVSRSYYPNGLLKTETQRIRTLLDVGAGGNFTSHSYTLAYTYDENGRRTELKHPANLAPRVAGVVRDKTTYQYHGFGPLQKVTDVLGHEYRHTFNMRSELDSLYLPRGVRERLTYDLDGNVDSYTVRNASNGLIRSLTLRYDGRGRLVKSLGIPDTLTVQHSGLGHLVKSSRSTNGLTVNGWTRRDVTHETFTNDALGNIRTSVSRDSSWINGFCCSSYYSDGIQNYDPITSRLLNKYSNAGSDSTWYDWAGNITFIESKKALNRPLSDRASFYDAEGRLRAADHRRYQNYGQEELPYNATFEEYRYDALGRRIWVRARRICGNYTSADKYRILECEQQLIRRTVWDGNNELWEIQMPGHDSSAYMENDTATVNLSRTQDNLDPHPFYGRVTYTHGLETDQPLGITRIGYVDYKSGTGRTVFQPFTVIPGWNLVGDPDRQYIAEAGVATCTGSGTAACVLVENPVLWLAYGAPPRLMSHWHGSIIEGKADRTGTFYRRNRYYDQATGRFTQEDPIGLAGGINLYGYANGDPVTYTDPFGLCPYAGRKRDTNIDDCPDDARKDVAGYLKNDTSGEGEKALALMANNRMGFSLTGGQIRCAGRLSDGCTRGVNMRVNLAQAGGAPAAATTLVHEVFHATRHASGMASPPYEEGMAWNRAINFYEALSAPNQMSPKYNQEMTVRQQIGPTAFIRRWP